MTTASSNPYRGFRFPGEIIQHAVWPYHCFSLSLRDVELILTEHGIWMRCLSASEVSGTISGGPLTRMATCLTSLCRVSGAPWRPSGSFVSF